MFRPASPMAKERLKICDTCPAKEGNICGICFCFLEAKAEIVEEDCPLDKWPKYENNR